MSSTEQQLDVFHYFPTEGNPVYMRKMRVEQGRVIGSHKHKYEHYSILLEGMAKAEWDDEVEFYYPGDVMVVPAGIEHRITALTAIVWFCVHGVEEADQDSIDEVLISKGV